MSAPTADWSEMIERLEKLERQNRLMKQAGAVALVVAAAVVLMGQASRNRTLEANAFILRDSTGPLARLEVENGRPILSLLDPVKRHPVVRLIGTAEGGALFLYDRDKT